MFNFAIIIYKDTAYIMDNVHYSTKDKKKNVYSIPILDVCEPPK